MHDRVKIAIRELRETSRAGFTNVGDMSREEIACLLELLSKELEEAKDLAERRLKRKNFYKERAERYTIEAIGYRLKLKQISRICDKIDVVEVEEC